MYFCSCVLCCAILSYPNLIPSSVILHHPIRSHWMTSYRILAPSYLILSNLIVYDPILTQTTSYHPIPSYPKISCQSFASYSIILFLFAVTYPHSATWSNLPISLLSPSFSSSAGWNCTPRRVAFWINMRILLSGPFNFNRESLTARHLKYPLCVGFFIYFLKCYGIMGEKQTKRSKTRTWYVVYDGQAFKTRCFRCLVGDLINKRRCADSA